MSHHAGRPASTGERTEPTTGGAAGDRTDLAARLRLSSTRLARRLRREAEIGLSPSLLSALAVVAKHGPLSLGRLAEIESVAPPTITKVVNKLERQGLVERVGDPEDRRVCRVNTTPAGDDLLAESRGRRTQWLASRMASLDPDQMAALADACTVIDRLLEDGAFGDGAASPGSGGRGRVEGLR